MSEWVVKHFFFFFVSFASLLLTGFFWSGLVFSLCTGSASHGG